MFILSKSNLATAVDGVWIDNLVVRFLPLSFYAKKKVAERKARIRGIAPRSASFLFGAVVRIAMQFLRMSFAHAPPFIYPPDDCSADSDLASYRPKCSASIMPRVSYFENARIKLGFFPYGKYAHPMPQKILLSNIQMRLLFAHPHLQEMVRIPRL